MNFVYFQDGHLRANNPEKRIDNYQESILEKIQEVIKIARENNATVLIGGDLWDVYNVTKVLSDKLQDIIEESNLAFYAIIGNHEEVGNNPELSENTTLAHMFRRCKNFKHLATLEGENYFIKGYDYYHAIENDIKEKGLTCDSKAPMRIALVHAMITLEDFFKDTLFVKADEIKSDFNVVLCSHYHHYWGIKKINNINFVNIGSLGRPKISERDIKPSCLLINTDEKKLKIIPLKCAKSASEIFDLNKLEEKKEFTQDIDKFVDALETQNVTVDAKLQDVITNVCKEQSIDKNIENDLIGRINLYDNHVSS